VLGAGRLGLRDHLGLSLRRRGRNRDRRQPGRPGLEYTNHTLAVAFDAEGAFLVRGAEQVHQRGKAVGTFVKRRRLRSYDLFDLPQVERPLANLGVEMSRKSSLTPSTAPPTTAGGGVDDAGGAGCVEADGTGADWRGCRSCRATGASLGGAEAGAAAAAASPSVTSSDTPSAGATSQPPLP